MPLSEQLIKTAKPKQKPYKLSDAEGLSLLVTPAGGRLWRLRYRYSGRESMIALGSYPATSLKQARERRDVALLEVQFSRLPAPPEGMEVASLDLVIRLRPAR